MIYMVLLLGIAKHDHLRVQKTEDQEIAYCDRRTSRKNKDIYYKRSKNKEGYWGHLPPST